MHYVTVYDAASFEPFLNLAFVAPGIIMIVAAVEALRRPGSWRGLPEPVLRWLYLPFAVLWTAVTAGALFSDAVCAAYWARTGQCTVLQGVVQHFRPEPPGGHGRESFDVNGVAFSFSDPNITAGFHFSGLLRQGLPVRICYRGPDILRLEVAEHPATPIRDEASPGISYLASRRGLRVGFVCKFPFPRVSRWRQTRPWLRKGSAL